jgi:hypothetical protein
VEKTATCQTLDEINARPAAQRAEALNKFAFKIEVDEDALKMLFPIQRATQRRWGLNVIDFYCWTMKRTRSRCSWKSRGLTTTSSRQHQQGEPFAPAFDGAPTIASCNRGSRPNGWR